jgi:DNA polymerase III gamma/tau subunit
MESFIINSKTTSTRSMNFPKTMLPAFLICGENNAIVDYTKKFLQRNFCKRKISPECVCYDCCKISNNQHHNVVWFSNESEYTKDSFELIFEKTFFILEDNELFFFVIDNAENMNITTANKMLKILEEPPRGYHFILLTKNIHFIIETIRSRCYIIELNEQSSTQYNDEIYSFFTSSINNFSHFELEKILLRKKPGHRQSLIILQELVAFFSQNIKNNHQLSYQDSSYEKLKILTSLLHSPPKSGGSKLLWKYLFMQFKSIFS